MAPAHHEVTAAEGAGATEIHGTDTSLVFPHREKSGDLVGSPRLVQGTDPVDSDPHPATLGDSAPRLGHGPEAAHVEANPDVEHAPVGIRGGHGKGSIILHDRHIRGSGNRPTLPTGG